MDKRRMEEISLVLLRYMAEKKGFRVSPDIKRDIGNMAKDTKVDQKELLEFGKIIAQELVEKSFA